MNLPDYKEALKHYDESLIRETYEVVQNKVFLGKKYYIRTYGCQMNVRDSETIMALVENLGFVYEDELSFSDLVIINTCSIRENAHNKTYGFINSLKRLKKEKPDLTIVLAGCMSGEEGVVKEILNKYKWIDIVIGPHNIGDLPKLLIDNKNNKDQKIKVYSRFKSLSEGMPVKRLNKYKAYVNIIYGCNKSCTYCIVPFTRGREVSRKMEDILKEVKELKKEGYQEIVLLGQNVNAYGKDIGLSLAGLIREIDKIGIPRLSFMTSHPWDFTDELIDVMASSKSIIPYLHLPVQSGSNTILRKMGRRYTKEKYLELINKIRDKIPGITITTDIIVGFPGETEEDFKETLDLVKKASFAGAYTFIYSPRENTYAAKLTNQVDLNISKERLKTLNKLINSYSLKDNKSYVGKEDEALVIGESKKEGKLEAYTSHNKLINLEGDKDNIGKIVKIKIEKAKTWSLDGKII